MMTFKLTWQNRRWSWHVYVCCILQGSIKTSFKDDWWFWCHSVPNLLGYKHTNNYSNIVRFDKFIAKRKWCSFFVSQYTKSYNRIVVYSTWLFIVVYLGDVLTPRTPRLGEGAAATVRRAVSHDSSLSADGTPDTRAFMSADET